MQEVQMAGNADVASDTASLSKINHHSKMDIFVKC